MRNLPAAEEFGDTPVSARTQDSTGTATRGHVCECPGTRPHWDPLAGMVPSLPPPSYGDTSSCLCRVLGGLGVETLFVFLGDPVSEDLEGSKNLEGQRRTCKGYPGEAGGFGVFVLLLRMFGDRVLASNSLQSCKFLISSASAS